MKPNDQIANIKDSGIKPIYNRHILIDNITMKDYIKFYSPIGELYIIEENGQLLEITTDQSHTWRVQDALAYKDLPDVLKMTCRFLHNYFNGINDLIYIPYKLDCSPFQKVVLEECRKIPFGHTISYGELAQRVKFQMMKDDMSAQAIGNALNHNPLLIYIPCHRVIRGDKTPGGYALGLKAKKILLENERNQEVIW